MVAAWTEAGRIASVAPHHLIFSIWAPTQVRAVLGRDDRGRFDTADFLAGLYVRALAPARA